MDGLPQQPSPVFPCLFILAPLLLITVFIAAMKQCDQKSYIKKRFIYLTLPHPSPSLKEVRAGIKQGRKHEAGASEETMKSAVYCFGHDDLLTLLS